MRTFFDLILRLFGFRRPTPPAEIDTDDAPDFDPTPTPVPLEEDEDDTDPAVKVPTAPVPTPPLPVTTASQPSLLVLPAFAKGQTPEPPPTSTPTSTPTPTEAPVIDLDPEKRRIVWSVLSVFETGKPEGDYGAVAVLKDGAGVSYGKHQSTDASGSLDAIVLRYFDLGGGAYGARLRPLFGHLSDDDTKTLDPVHPETWPSWATELVGILKLAGTDPVMRRAQDEVFSERYWVPCRDQCLAMRLVFPLSWCAVYDTCIQSNPTAVAGIRKKFSESPPASGGDERRWTEAYLEARRAWIATFHNAAHPERDATVRSTIYRTESLLALVRSGNWGLDTPFTVEKPRATVV